MLCKLKFKDFCLTGQEKYMYNYQDSVSLNNYFQQCYIAPLRMDTKKEDRRFNEKARKSLLPHLPKKKEVIELTAIAGDYEAFQFASEIRSYLKDEGYNVKEVNQSIFSQAIKGQTIELRKTGGIRIVIGKA